MYWHFSGTFCLHHRWRNSYFLQTTWNFWGLTATALVISRKGEVKRHPFGRQDSSINHSITTLDYKQCLLYTQTSYYSNVKAYYCTKHKMTAHKHQGILSTLYEENGNDYDTHLCIFYMMMTSDYSASGSYHHSTGQKPLSTRKLFLFYHTFLQAKHLLTQHIKIEYLLLSMNLLMCHQVTLFTKCFITHNTAKWLLFTAYPLMSYQTILKIKCLILNITQEWLFSTVYCLCAIKCLCCLNALLQKSHKNGYSPLCSLLCAITRRLLLQINAVLQTSHTNGRSPVCIRLCCIRWLRWIKALLLMSHNNGCLPLCIHLCTFRLR